MYVVTSLLVSIQLHVQQINDYFVNLFASTDVNNMVSSNISSSAFCIRDICSSVCGQQILHWHGTYLLRLT